MPQAGAPGGALLSNGLVAMRDSLEDAWDELHLVTPAGWHVGRPGQRHGVQSGVFVIGSQARTKRPSASYS